MSTQHTPGPWQVGHTKTDAHMCEVMTAAYSERPNLMPSHKVICRTWSRDDQPPASFIGFSRQECLANACLIAAAPDLLSALENLTIAIGMGWDLDGVLDVANAVIAKATAATPG